MSIVKDYDTMDYYTSKLCKKCETVKPLYEFSKNKTRNDGHDSRCKDCRKEYLRQYYQDNREKHIELSRQHYQDNKEYANERQRAYYIANRDRLLERGKIWYSKNKKRSAETNRRYREENREVIRAINRRNKARKKNAVGSHTAEDILTLLDKQNYQCAYCAVQLDLNNYHVDHIRPLVRGGRNDINNLACACPRCNLSKNSKTLTEWAKSITDKIMVKRIKLVHAKWVKNNSNENGQMTLFD